MVGTQTPVRRPATCLRSIRGAPPFARSMGAALAIGLAAISLRCGGERQEAEVPPSVPAERSARQTFDVHEWGLVAMSIATDEERGVRTDALRPALTPRPRVHQRQSPPPQINRTPAPAKPVLYFHLIGEVREPLSLDVIVRVAGGRIVEHFPPGVPLLTRGSDDQASAEDALAWRGVQLSPGACRGTYPSATSAACGQGDGYCERAELPLFETTDADCVQHGEFRGGLLFYRGADSPMTPPLSVEAGTTADAPGGYVVTAGASGVPTALLMVQRGRTRAATRVRSVARPEPGRTLRILPADTTDSTFTTVDEAFLTRFVAPMREAGLTTEEVAAFRRAWDEALFGGSAVDASGAGRTALLYWLPRRVIDEAMPLTIDPAPRNVRRAMLMVVDLGPSARFTDPPNGSPR